MRAYSALAVLLLCPRSTYLLAAELYVPQVVAGRDDTLGLDFVSRFHLVNLSGVPATAEVEARMNDSSPLKIFEDPGSSGLADKVSVTVPAWGQETVNSVVSDGLKVGWARIQTTGPFGIVVTLAAYSLDAPGQVLTSTSLIPDEKKSEFTAYALISKPAKTGVAVLNPSTTDNAETIFRIIDKAGIKIEERNRTFQPLEKISQFLNDSGLFEELQSVEGSLEVESSIPLAATVIRVDGQYWSSFGTFPARSPHNGVMPESLPNVIGVDLGLFPSDPQTYSGSEVFVSTVGSDEEGDGSVQNPYRTIFHAISVAGGGSIITVRGGLYSEGDPDEFRALVIANDNLVVRAMPGETVTVQPSRTGVTYGVEISASNVVLDGINLSGFSSAGISLANEAQTLSNLVIKNLSVTMADPNDGIVAYSDFTDRGGVAVDGLLIKNVIVTGAGLGISCNSGPCDNWRLENVAVKNSSQMGGSGADAIAVENGDNFLFFGGEVTGADADGIDIKADRALVYNAHVHHVGRNGVKLWQRAEIINCLIHHTGADAGVVLDQGSRARIVNSIIAFHNYGVGEAYVLTAGYDVPGKEMEIDLINTVFFNNSGGLYFSPASLVNVRNCLFSGHENGKIMDVSSRVGAGRLEIFATDANSIFETHGIGSGNLAFDTDPGFVHPAAGDFTFRQSSPLVDRGHVPEAFPSFDRLLRPRVKSGKPDLGPDELF